jgi:hypothetical protein
MVFWLEKTKIKAKKFYLGEEGKEDIKYRFNLFFNA